MLAETWKTLIAFCVICRLSLVKGSCDIAGLPSPDHAKHNLKAEDSPFPTDTMAQFTCDYGYTLSGAASSLCRDDGTWLTPVPTVCTAVSCGNPGSVENGEKDSFVYTVGATVTYSCNLGYERTGRATLTCYASGRWSEPLPTCTAIKCPELQAPANGAVDGLKRTYGSQVTLQCNPGYMPAGPTTAVCQLNKRWSNQPFNCIQIDCGLPPDVPNAVVDLPGGTTEGSEARVTCFANATSSNPNPFVVIFCTSEAVWGKPQTCLGCCSVDSDDPSDPSFPFIPGAQCVPSGQSRPSSDYSCAQGYYIQTAQTALCYNGTMDQRLTCERIKCEIPKIEFGSVVGLAVNAEVDYGTNLTVECATGYELRTPNSVTCDLNIVFPRCHPVKCEIPKIEFGSVVGLAVNTEVDYGRNLTVECATGYELRTSNSVTCIGSDTVFPVCHRVKCLTPEITFGHIVGVAVNTEVDYGRNLTVECATGYELRTPNSAVICDLNIVFPRCHRVKCEIPKIEFGSVVGLAVNTEVDYGRKLTVECTAGYELRTPNSVTCDLNIVFPRCHPVKCEIPNIEFGSVVGLAVNTEVDYGRNLTVECATGYELRTSNSVTCIGSDTVFPVCHRVKCITPEIRFGQIVGVAVNTEVDYGRNLTVECATGYELRTPNSAVMCDLNIVFPRCHRVKCEIPKIKFGSVVGLAVNAEVDYGRNLTVECTTGYELQTSNSSVICDRGVVFPKCQPASCTIPQSSQSIVASHSGAVAHGTRVTFTCGECHVIVADMSQSKESSCTNGQLQVPVCEKAPCPLPPDVAPGTSPEGVDCMMKGGQFVRHGCAVSRICGQNEEVMNSTCDCGKWRTNGCPLIDPPGNTGKSWKVAVGIVTPLLVVFGILAGVLAYFKFKKSGKKRSGNPHNNSETVVLQAKSGTGDTHAV